ncbi:hypothetical protein [Rossellomorea sp. BNER]|uniref:hypothetical protein n=1 Tax=Rossellomorea sp. BNER TaxID=2962031 RepID=UPI003AF21144|nr:hypothetical protein [Rossellomorea sp. BNER]
MTVNNSGNLSVEYFISYMNLLRNALGLTIEGSKNHLLQIFFNEDPKSRGLVTYRNFLEACNRVNRDREE